MPKSEGLDTASVRGWVSEVKILAVDEQVIAVGHAYEDVPLAQSPIPSVFSGTNVEHAKERRGRRRLVYLAA
jgi:hypothetical protein